MTPATGKELLFGTRWACARLASWWGKGLPRQWSIAGLGGRTATLGLRQGPNFYGGQQWGILDNGRKPDPAMPHEWLKVLGL